jgi:prepilin-type N-terminal cleavage/methylation domain-containing protein
MRAIARGFTLLEMMVVVAIMLILGGLVVWYGRSARQAATIATGAYELVLQIGGLKARAMAAGKDHLLVLTDTPDPAACVRDERRCGRVLVLSDPQPGFTIQNFNPEPPYAGVSLEDSGYLPRNSKFELTSTWRAPAPFDAIAPWDAGVRTTCAGGVACFAIRFRANGEIKAELPAPGPDRRGFAFVIAPHDIPSRAAERRGVFVSFPAGIVKTGSF